jgi:hypothetical protein
MILMVWMCIYVSLSSASPSAIERWPQWSFLCILGGSPRESRRKIRRIRGIRRKRRIRRIRRRRIRRTRRIRKIRRIRKKDEDKAVKRKLLV